MPGGGSREGDEEGDEVPPGFPIAIWGTKKDEDISGLLAQFEERKGAAAKAAPKAEAALRNSGSIPPSSRTLSR